MVFTPAHLQVLGRSDLSQAWKQDLIQVKELYLEGRYKKCAVLCEDLQKEAEHSMHKAFLYFFQGICYESSGIAAHDYSSTKLPLLHDAEGSFALALQVLPQPYASTDLGQPYTPEGSPRYDFSSILQQYDSSRSSSPESLPCLTCLDETHVRSDTASSTYSDILHGWSPLSDVANLDHCSRPGDTESDSESPPHSPNTDASAQRRDNSKARLCQSLSSKHVLAEEIVPSPLSKVKRSMQTIETLPTSRPLPPLPFDHRPTFLLKAGRQVLVPTRKSAIQTLVAKYEGSILTTPSPTTPRFNQISRAFSPISTNLHLKGYLTSVSLAKYNEYLSSFRDQLIRHSKAIREHTDRAIEVQQQHKENRLSRMASFWSFKPADPSSEIDPALMARRDRITRLKAEGWVVRKERHGWKGQAYYDRLRQQAEDDLY